jgi:hypothetical protein
MPTKSRNRLLKRRSLCLAGVIGSPPQSTGTPVPMMPRQSPRRRRPPAALSRRRRPPIGTGAPSTATTPACTSTDLGGSATAPSGYWQLYQLTWKPPFESVEVPGAASK